MVYFFTDGDESVIFFVSKVKDESVIPVFFVSKVKDRNNKRKGKEKESVWISSSLAVTHTH